MTISDVRMTAHLNQELFHFSN